MAETADKKKEAKLNWKQKLNQRKPLNKLDEVKADADFNYKRRLREEEEKKEYERLKAAGRSYDSEEDQSNAGTKGK